jgi:hypothetical protein
MSRWRAATAHPQGVFWPHPGEWHQGAADPRSAPGAG